MIEHKRLRFDGKKVRRNARDMMSGCAALFGLKGFCAAALLTGITIGNANALEGGTPFLPGVTIGVPVGALPPIGLYYSTSVSFFNYKAKNNSNQDVGPKIRATTSSNSFLYIPDIPEILGAKYGAFIVQGVTARSTGNAKGTFTGFGTVNTLVSPVNLSWNLHNGFFISAGLTGYIKDSQYTPGAVIQFARNYWTLEPSIGLSYLANGWNITLHPVFDLSTENATNGYQSGAIFLMDYTASHKFGKLDLGVGGTYTQQIGNDQIHGTAIAATANNGFGNRVFNFTVGPVVGYDFGVATVKAYYNRSVYAQNVPAGDSYWFRIDVPLFSKNPRQETRTDSGGVRE